MSAAASLAFAPWAAGEGLEIWSNPAAGRAASPPVLSVLIPFRDSDPGESVRGLARLAEGEPVEIVCADDGSADAAAGGAVALSMENSPVAFTLLRTRQNRGRAAIRNLLCRAARGQYVLFLDSDMLPADEDYLGRWLALAAGRRVEVAYGGFQMERAETADRAHDLHVFQSRRTDCLVAEQRRRNPAKYIYTNNLLVARRLMQAEPFDEAFAGWGWEDVEWGMRAAARAEIVHVDNPAVHRGFASTETLVRKYRESVANFQRLYERHPAAVAALPLFRASRWFGRLPGAGQLERLFEAAALDRYRMLPLRARYAAMKLLRACLYREVGRPGRARR